MKAAAWSLKGLNSRKYRNWLALAIIAFFIAFGIASVQKVSITMDEPLHYQYGMNILNLKADRLTITPGVSDLSKMPITALNALPSQIALYLPGGEMKDFLESFFTARLITILFSGCIAYLVFHWARELYGFHAGMAALLLYIFDPNIIAHSQLVTNDIYVTGTILISCYWMWKFARDRNLKNGLISGLATGLSQIAKMTALALYPIFFICLLLYDLPVLIKRV